MKTTLQGNGVILPAEKCLFPIRNDGNTPEDTPGKRWEIKKLSSCTLRKAGILRSCSCSSCQNQTNSLEQKDPLYFMAAVWTLLLWEFAEVDTVQIGVHHILSSSDESVNKQHMRLLASTRSQITTVNELSKPEGWSISNVSEDHYPYFNTGLVLYDGQEGENVAALGCLERANTVQELLPEGEQHQEVCDITLVLDLDQSEWFIAYKTSLLSSGQAEHLASFLDEAVVTIATKGNTCTPSHLTIASTAQHNIIKRWNSKTLIQPSTPTIHQIIHNNSLTKPDHLALLADDGSLTYTELETVSSQLASHLQALGVRPGMFIPVCFNKTLWAIVAMLAINKTGAAFVTLDAAQPLSRLKLIVKQLNGPVIGLASPANQALLNEVITPTLAVSESTVSELPKNEQLNDWPIDATSPSYCFFTSGSTGEPKGCVVDHAALASVATHSHALHLDSASRVLQFASFSFGVSLIEIWCTLAAGGTVCMPSDSDRVSRLGDAIEAMAINWAFVTPTVLGTIHPDVVPGVRRILVAGEPLKKAQISLWAKRTNLFQAYGFTEWAGVCCVSPQIHSIADIGIIGTAANARCWLIEPGNPERLAPIGAVGELLVEGPSLAQGYLHSPDKSAVSFLKAPLWRRQGPFKALGRNKGELEENPRCYKTGDLAYYDSNGLLRYVSRKDRQVKVHGQRIDLGEPEFHVAQASNLFRKAAIDAIVPSSGDGVAILVTFVPATSEPHASNNRAGQKAEDSGSFFVLPDEEFVATAQLVIKGLAKKLPDVMIPRIFVLIKSMPLTVTGKIDRRRLREEAEKLRHEELLRWARAGTTSVSLAAVNPPRTPHEQLIHRLVVEVLRLPLEQVGMEHDFFGLGGDSVKAMKLVSRARASGIELTVAHIFRAPQLQKFASITAKLGHSTSVQSFNSEPFALLNASLKPVLMSTATTQCRVEESQVEDIYPCTSLQEGMMALSAARPGAYVARFIHRMQPHVDSGRLRHAWEMVVNASPILRTRVVSAPSGGMFQVVLRENFQWDDAAPDAEVDWFAYIKKRQREPLLLGYPLVHATLLKGSTSCDNIESDPSSTYFIVTMHHSVCDRWAGGLLLGRLEKAYSGQTLVPNLMTPFMHYLQQNLSNPSTKEYWKSQFKDLQAESFPPLPSPGYNPVPTESCHLSISCQRDAPSGYTISNVLRLAWALVISHYTSSADVVFGITVSGRSAPVAGIEQMIAPIVATVPLRVLLNPGDTVLNALSAIQKQFTEMIPFEHYGLQHIRKVSSDAADGCSFQSHLVVQPSWDDEHTPLLTTLEAGPAVAGGFASSALLVACSLTSSQKVNITVEFDPLVIPVLGVKHIMSHFEQTIQWLLAEPLSPLADIPLLSPMDVQQLTKWSANMAGGGEQCVHETIKRRCIEYPTSTAIWAWDGRFTYSELDRISDRLAAQLIVEHGIEPEVIVPICMDKSCWAIVAIVGVMKAGGAFVLLDTSQPQKGLESICCRTNARIILTSQGNTELAQTLVATVLVIDQNQSGSWPATACKPDVPSNPKSTLYVAFTSGSTGTPKGAVTEHHSICFSLPAFNTAAQVTHQSRVLQFSSYSFDCSIMETLGALMAGACLCVPSEFQRRNELVSAVKKFSLTHAYLTPSLARHVLRSDPDFAKILVSVGEPLMPSDVTDWAGTNPKCRVMNAYGPAECAIVTTVQTQIAADSNPRNLGFPLASICCWVVHPENHDILIPIGAVGELVIEGPTVGRGYLNDPVQSSAVYISSPPSWMHIIRPGGFHGRLYKTGDLVRYHSDGSLEFVGRRDSQVKLRGQRIELGGVEKHVHQCWPEIKDVAVEMITFKSGLSSTQTLVAFVVVHVSDEEGRTNDNGDGDGLLLDKPNPLFRDQAAEAYAQLYDRIPTFMVPEIYLPVRALPKSTSGKLDRRQLNNIAKGCSQEQLALYRGDSVARQKRTPASEAERIMQAMWASVLNRPLEEIGVDDNFYHLGGDSITAMQIVALARTKNIYVSVNEIMRFKTISQVLLHAVSPTAARRRGGGGHTSNGEVQEELDVFFPLSPIQKMFMDQQQVDGSWNRFNQTFLLRLAQPISLGQLQVAIHALVSRHSMLRARFSRLPDDGQWGQTVTAAATVNKQPSHFTCTAYRLESRAELDEVMAASSRSIDIENGPLAAADLIDMAEDNSQHLFLVIHHLVIDLVSWRIILSELEAMLRGKTLSKINDSIPFQTWCRLQAQYAQQSLSPNLALPLNLSQSYYEDPSAFWLASPGLPNRIADTQLQTFTLDEKTTRQLLGVANAAFNTQPVEILHAALLHSFVQIFPNRAMPLAFSESHGRESWDPAIDLAETVGWFTALWPVVVTELEKGSHHDPLEVIRRVKDARRAVPSKGWAYFASRYLNIAGRKAFQQRHPIELIFNYSGEYQQLEHADALFVAESHQAQGALDAGGDIQRFGIFEVFASVQRSRLQFQFMYPRKIQHQDSVNKWVKACQKTLESISSQLMMAAQTERHISHTLSDFPLLPSLKYSQLQELIHMTLPALGISIDNVEDIYPCSPSQRGMLIAQAKQAHSYNTSVTWKIQFRDSNQGKALDLRRLHSACCQVISRHAGLRTVFVDSSSPDSYMDQIVLKHANPEAVIKLSSESEFNPLLTTQSNGWPKGQLMHRMNLCKMEDGGDGEVFLRWDISHTIMDRTTMQIIERDLCIAYEGKLPQGRGPLYSDYISHIYQQDTEADSCYWKQYLEGVEPCQFPSINADENASGIQEEDWGVVSRILYQSSLGKTTIDNFCRTHNVTMWNLAGLAWALVLRSFTNSDNVCFGYVKSARDLPIDGIEDAVGAILNPLACRVSFDDDSTVQETVHQLQEEYLESLEHQSFPLSDAHRLAGVTNGLLFNTYVGVQSGQIDSEEDRALKFTIMDLKDEAEFDILVSVTPGPNLVALNIRYKTHVLSHLQATTVIATFEKTIRSIITASSDTPITAVDIFSEHDREIIWTRNQTPSAPVESCAHEIIHQRCIDYPDSEAVCDTEGSFTYRELDELSSHLARYLIVDCGGVAPNEVVPICLERTRWTPVAMLGVLKAGGTFLLLDTSYPHQRRVETCRKVNARIAVISSTHSATDMELASTTVLVGSGSCSWDKWEQNSDKILLPKVQPDHALYVVFTSGSTGNPKGLVIDHRSYCTGARDHIEAWKLTRQSRVTQFASYAFDMCVLEQLSVLMAGACICIVSDEQRNNLGEAASALKANFAMLVPSVARLFRPEDLPTIDTLMLAGECMTKTDVSSWAYHVRLLNGYGPSECSPLSAVQSTISTTSDPRNVGQPIGCVFWVVDAHDHNKLVPPGAIGELVIEGPIVGLGYINQPEQTAKAFIEPTAWLRSLRPHQRAGTCLYKTGDLVRLKSDGSLIVIGRKDRQVKVRGQRLELAEVEAHVHRCFQGAALDVVAEMLTPAETSRSQLVGLVLCQEPTGNGEQQDTIPERSDILKAPSKDFAAQVAAAVIKLRQTVPEFMVPTIFLPLRQMPRTYSGKVDRNRLRNLVGSMSLEELQSHRELSSSPSSAIVTNGDLLSTNKERTLGDIWAQVLELPIDTISVHDNFFLRGGHSIDAMKVAALSRAAGMALSVVDIFAHPILSNLAKVAVLKKVDDVKGNSSRPFSLSPIDNPKALHARLCAKGIIPTNSTMEDLLPATQSQDLFIQRKTFHSYNWTIKDRSMDMDRIRATCQTLVNRYSILRTCFVQHEGRPLQMILGNFEAEILEFACSQDEDPLAFSKALWDRTDSPTLEGLGASLPFRFTLVSHPGQQHVVLTIQISHAQWDGISIPQLFSDFASIFNQTPLPPTSDFSQYSYHRALPPQVQKETHPDFQFWREYLAGAEMATPFPSTTRALCAEAAAAEQSQESLWTVKGISPPPPLPAGVTMATLVKSASAFFLSHHLLQRDLVFGHTTNGRNMAMDNIESMLGCCLNFIPLRITFPESPAAWTVRDLMEHVQNQYIRALPHEHVELREIFEHSKDWPAETPLNFIVQHQNIDLSYKLPLRRTVGVTNGEEHAGARGEDEGEGELLDVEFSRFARFKSLDEVWLFTEPHSDRLEVQICGNARVLPQEKATDMSDKICSIIEKFAANPEMKLVDIIL